MRMSAAPIACQIAPATPADVPALVTLLGELFTQEEEFAPDPAAQERGLRAILAEPALGQIFVARAAETAPGPVLGMANLLFTVSTALGGRVALLDDFVVSASARGQGIGSALLEWLFEFARDAGIGRINLQTDLSNHAAQRLYARHGFARSNMLVYSRAIGGESG